MKIRYSYNKKTVVKSVEGEPPFILTNKKGGFYVGSPNTTFSKFNGLFFPFQSNTISKEWDMFKIIDFIGVKDEITSMSSSFSEITISKKSAKETFYLNHSNSLIYEVSASKKPVSFFLDCKKIYDDSTIGRDYSYENVNGTHLISYTKYTDEQNSVKEYSFFVAIKTDLDISGEPFWEKKLYSLDKSRGDSFEKWLYSPFSFLAKTKGKVVISYSEDKEEALNLAQKIFQTTTYIKKHKKKYVETLLKHAPKNISQKDFFVYANACVHFDSLHVQFNSHEGIFAGLPWFFHFWSRDEAISLIGLLKEEQYDVAKKILLRWTSAKEGLIPNRFPFAGLGSADATGWIYFRLRELVETLDSKKLLSEYFSQKELTNLLDSLLKRISYIEKTHLLENGFIHNAALETWMDTGNPYDVRSGFRVEIQALYASLLSSAIYFSKILSKKKQVELFSLKRAAFLKKFKEAFFKNNYLQDGLDDSLIRPNAFIVAYLLPELLDKKEWVSCFKILLSKLYISHKEGGLISSIDKEHPLFKEWHSGQNNESYHRGDSWYYLNCLVLIVLKRMSPKVFSKEIASLEKAVFYEVLWDGAIGALAEISSAKKVLPQGCLSQAWSYALLLEYLHEK